MAVENKKGFVYTLEAVIAAGLLLTTVTVVIPEIDSQTNTNEDVQERVHTSVLTLDRTGELRDNLTPEAIEEDLNSSIPEGYSFSATVRSVSEDTQTVNSPDEIYLNKTGDEFEVQFWILNSNDLNITFNGSKEIEFHNGEEYILKTLDHGEGFLNFTGTGKTEFSFRNYSTKGRLPNASDVKNVNYILKENRSREVRVSLWEKED